MRIAVVTDVPDPFDSSEVIGNLAAAVLYTADGVADPGISLAYRVPVFALGEILILDNSGREYAGEGRAPGKWDITTKEVATLEEAVELAQRVTADAARADAPKLADAGRTLRGGAVPVVLLAILATMLLAILGAGRLAAGDAGPPELTPRSVPFGVGACFRPWEPYTVPAWLPPEEAVCVELAAGAYCECVVGCVVEEACDICVILPGRLGGCPAEELSAECASCITWCLDEFLADVWTCTGDDPQDWPDLVAWIVTAGRYVPEWYAERGQ